MIKPINRYVNVAIEVKCSNVSGIRWKKAPLNNAPADNATKESTIFFNSFSLHHREKIPTNDTRLFIRVARIIKDSMCIFLIRVVLSIYKIICFLEKDVEEVS